MTLLIEEHKLYIYQSWLYPESIRQDESWGNDSIIPLILPLIHQREEQNKTAVKILSSVSPAPASVPFGLAGVLLSETLSCQSCGHISKWKSYLTVPRDSQFSLKA